MEGFIALILAGTIFRTPGTWASTRLISIVDCVVAALLYAFPGLRVQLTWVWIGMLGITLVVWAANVIALPRLKKDG